MCSLESFTSGSLQTVACLWTSWDSVGFISSQMLYICSFIWRCEDIWITHCHIDCWGMVTNMMIFNALCSHGYQTWLFCNLFLWSCVKGTMFMPSLQTNILELKTQDYSSSGIICWSHTDKDIWRSEPSNLDLPCYPWGSHKLSVGLVVNVWRLLIDLYHVPSIIYASFTFYECLKCFHSFKLPWAEENLRS